MPRQTILLYLLLLAALRLHARFEYLSHGKSCSITHSTSPRSPGARRNIIAWKLRPFASSSSPSDGSITFNSSFNELSTLRRIRDRGEPADLSTLTTTRASVQSFESPLMAGNSSKNLTEDGVYSGLKPNLKADVKAASVIASSALIFEGVQAVGTALLGYIIHESFPQATSVDAAIQSLSGTIQSMGALGYLVYAAVQIFFQVIPIASAFAMTVSAGIVFGSITGGVAVVSMASTFSAAVSFTISRYLAKDQFDDFKNKSSQLKAIDTALADAGPYNSLLLMFLFRCSPIIPFAWANYLFGLSRVPFVPFVLGTFLGTLPGITALVSAGKFGEEVIGGRSGGLALQAGLVATVLSLVLVGRISDAKLKEMNIDLDGSEISLDAEKN